MRALHRAARVAAVLGALGLALGASIGLAFGLVSLCIWLLDQRLYLATLLAAVFGGVAFIVAVTLVGRGSMWLADRATSPRRPYVPRARRIEPPHRNGGVEQHRRHGDGRIVCGRCGGTIGHDEPQPGTWKCLGCGRVDVVLGPPGAHADL